MKAQIKARERVVKHGEVFTNEREVKAMLDLVKYETERIESRFLEPACGDGNFLAEILLRKLLVAKKASTFKGRFFPQDYEKKSVLALCSIYGVELLQDNVDICKERLYEIWEKEYLKNCKADVDESIKEVARFILNHNILCGDTLTMLKNNGEPIIFSQWDLVGNDNIKRRDFRLDELLRGGKDNEEQLNLTNIPNSEWYYDEQLDVWMPQPIKEYPLINYRRVIEND